MKRSIATRLAVLAAASLITAGSALAQPMHHHGPGGHGGDVAMAIAALIQATAAKLYILHARNQDYRQYSRALVMENKWRAVRYGLDGKLIDFGKEAEVPERELILEYLDFVAEVVDELDSHEEIAYIRKILEMGTGADRQLRKFEETDDLKAVVDYMAEETQAGLFEN